MMAILASIPFTKILLLKDKVYLQNEAEFKITKFQIMLTVQRVNSE